MILTRIINLLVPITLIEMMIFVGLSVPLSEVIAVTKNIRLATTTLIANYIFVPAATVALLLYFHANPMISAGFLILAVCPGAPFLPPVTAIAKGNVTVATGLMVLLTASSAIAAPLLLSFLLPLLSIDKAGEISTTKILTTLLITQLLPLAAGLAIRTRYPPLAIRLQLPAKRLSALLNLSTIALVLTAQYQTLLAIRVRGLLGMLTLLAATLLIGYLSGALAAADRKATALAAALRNIGVGLVIANSAFPNTPALNAVIAYGLIGVIGSLAIAFLCSIRSHPRPTPTPTPIPT